MAQKFIKIFDDTVLKQTILQGIEDDRIKTNLGKFSMGELAFTRNTGRLFVGNYSSSSKTQNSDPVLGGILVGNKYLGHVETKRKKTKQSDITSPLYYVEKTYSNEGNTTTGGEADWTEEPVLINEKWANSTIYNDNNQKWLKSTSYNEKYDAYNGDYVIDPYASSIIFFDDKIGEDKIDKNVSNDENAPFNPFGKHPLQGDGYFIFRNIEPDNDTLCYDVKNSYHNIIKLNKVPLNLLSNSFDTTYFEIPVSGSNNTISLNTDAIKNIFESPDVENDVNVTKKLVYSFSNGSTNLFNQSKNLANNAFLYLTDANDGVNKKFNTIENLSIGLKLNGNLKFKTSDGYTRSETKSITPSNNSIEFSEIVIHSQSENKSESTQTLISDPFSFQKDFDNSYAISGTNVFDNGMLISTDNIPNNFKDIIEFSGYAQCTECYSHNENSLSSLNYFKKPSLLCQKNDDNSDDNGKLQKIVNYDDSQIYNEEDYLNLSVSLATSYNDEIITEINNLSVTEINGNEIDDVSTYKFYILDDQNNNKIFYSITNLYNIINNNDFSLLKKIKIGGETYNIDNVTQTDEEATIEIDNTDEPFDYHTLKITYEMDGTSTTKQSKGYVFKNDVPSDVWEKLLDDNNYVKIDDGITGSLFTNDTLGTSLIETFDPFSAEYYNTNANDTNFDNFTLIETIKGEPTVVEYYDYTDGDKLKIAIKSDITFCDENGNTTFKTPDEVYVKITSSNNVHSIDKDETNATHFRFKESTNEKDYLIKDFIIDENGKLKSVTYSDTNGDTSEENIANVEEIILLQELTITHEEATHFYLNSNTEKIFPIDNYYGFFVSNSTIIPFDKEKIQELKYQEIKKFEKINEVYNDNEKIGNYNYIPRHAQSVILGIHCNAAIKVFTNNTIESADELPSGFTATYVYDTDSNMGDETDVYKLIYQRTDAGYGTIELPMYKDKNGRKIASFYPLTTENTTTTAVGKFKIYILGYRA